MTHPTDADVAREIAAALKALSERAATTDLGVLAYLIDMARLEAERAAGPDQGLGDRWRTLYVGEQNVSVPTGPSPARASLTNPA